MQTILDQLNSQLGKPVLLLAHSGCLNVAASGILTDAPAGYSITIQAESGTMFASFSPRDIDRVFAGVPFRIHLK